MILDEFGKAAQAYLTEGFLTSAKLVLRFLAGLQGMVEGHGLYSVLGGIVDQAASYLTAGEAVSCSMLPSLPLPYCDPNSE